jgi:hypothetical protein
MREFIKSVNSENTHKAFLEVCTAIAALQQAKNRLSDYHYCSKRVDDAHWLLDHVGEYATPSDDAHEMLFNQLEIAKQKLRDAQSGSLFENIKLDLESAYKATDNAWSLVKKP